MLNPALAVSPTATVREALEAITKNGRQAVLVVGADGRLAGIVTDGDARRAILRGVPLDSPARALMNARPITAPASLPRGARRALLAERRLHQLPLLDEAGRVVGLERLDAVAAVEVDQDVGRRDQPVEDRARERVCVRPVVRPRKAAIEVLAVLGNDERRTLLEGLHAHHGDGRDRACELLGIELFHEADHGGDGGVLAAVDAGDQREVRTVTFPARLEGGMLETRKPRVGEDDRPALHHPAILARPDGKSAANPKRPRSRPRPGYQVEDDSAARVASSTARSSSDRCLRQGVSQDIRRDPLPGLADAAAAAEDGARSRRAPSSWSRVPDCG